MAGIFDTHTHFNDVVYKEKEFEVSDMISEAKIIGVSNFCCVGFDIKSSREACKYALKYPNVYAAVGIHPNDVNKFTLEDLDEIDTMAHGENVVAVGEIGLDYYYTSEDKEVQKKFFREQIKIALKNDLAVMMHIRDKDDSDQAYLDALEILDELKVERAIVHCYTRGIELAKKFTSRGYLISIPGVVTFKNATSLHETVEKLSLNEIIVETDAPYLTPEPKRGKLNMSKNIVYTIEKIASIRKINKADVIEATTSNAMKVFNLE
ncbi:TatD family hydrolase [Spiroplasma floricola]|uniref:Mg-dependent DNase n=1 Tax=Spiroplasma floricola 23-6 TaxID=1336749 RepID=A0A2K8SH73_9MOLU|nr:TatD family hydrolase [Spiroplasma floricola]AUB32180.1 Mg-dependent DNase [Spiroplasma floricola 23-6]